MNIAVIIHRASGLPSTDSTTAIDPYVVVTVGDQVGQTDVQRSAGSTPEFNEHEFVFEWYYGISLVRFTLKDQDSLSSDDHVCSGELAIVDALHGNGDKPFEVNLVRGKNQKSAGVLFVNVVVNVEKEVFGKSIGGR